ncbi:MAG: YdeI/OmpD-associated family protein [Alphaproteobacteria bacterium]|nr:YdeI/OmpD-associated family protein [Alphaproteobacteria bacterium]MBT8475209.1 YdeI/OmpD-associated family protein [Alphaproteobacteria bacterium]NNF72694.1 YdeI/OmpD-associated family protein [Paracoccaceae bacterium]
MSALKRPIQPMPPDIAALLDARKLRAAYDARPPYQRNDWLAWIGRAKREETRTRRIESMLSELEQGHGYMGMAWKPRE